MHPVFFGSAITGAGVAHLTAGITELLPAADVKAEADGPVSAAVFKVERGPAGEKIAYARMFSGTLRTRDRVGIGAERRGEDHGDQRLRPRPGQRAPERRRRPDRASSRG